MDGNRFDALTRTFAGRLSRRRAVGLGAAGLAAAAAGAGGLAAAAAQDATPGTGTPAAVPSPGQHPEFLFVQIAEGGTWAPKAGEDGVYTLTLTGAAAQTIYFSDRPERVVGSAPMEAFLGALGFTPENPPNAALVAQTDTGEDVLVIELLAPAYDEATSTLTYDARILENYQEQGLQFLADQQGNVTMPGSFKAASLFIDDCADGYVTCRVGNQSIGQITAGACYTPIRCELCNRDTAYWAGQCNATYAECNGGCTADTSYCSAIIGC